MTSLVHAVREVDEKGNAHPWKNHGDFVRRTEPPADEVARNCDTRHNQQGGNSSDALGHHPTLTRMKRPRQSEKSGQASPTAATLAGITGHLWSFDEVYQTVIQYN